MDWIIETPYEGPHTYNIRRLTFRFIIQLSIFYLLLSYFPSFILHNPLSFLTNNIKLNYDGFSTLISFPLFDRNYMFLVCNGILVILAKNLRLDSTSSGGIQITEMPLEDVEQVDYSPTSIGMLAEERPVSILIQKPPKMLSKEGENQENAGTLMENDNNSDVKNIEDLKEKQPTFLEVQETEVRACLGRESEREEEDEEEEEEELDTSSSEMDVVTSDVHVSTEELNMKFEEFIRKMKEELRIEARNTMIEAV